MEELYKTMHALLAQTDTSFNRYLYPNIKWENRMLALVGPRGIGKTTLFLQHIKQKLGIDSALYISADHLYFSTHTLYETAEKFVQHAGLYLFVDEVHKYPQWSRELKMIYDNFSDLHVYFTGSSILDVTKGDADLSRRAPTYHMQGLSFREFLKIRHNIEAPLLTLEDILSNKAKIPNVEHPLPLFKEYVKDGYYPFGSEPDFLLELNQVIDRTLEIDIPQYANLSVATGRKLKRLMAIISTLAPFKPNITSLAKQIQASRNSIESYLSYLEKAGMIGLLSSSAQGLGRLGKPEKVYLDNTNIMYALGGDSTDKGNARETFFFNQMRVNHQVRASATADFDIDGTTFEVGGRNKTFKQLQGTENGYLVKDGIEYGYERSIPLWAFGLNY